LRATLHLQAVPDYTTLYRFCGGCQTTPSIAGCVKTVRCLRQRRSRAVVVAVDGRASLTIPSAVSLSGEWNSKPSAVRAIVIG
jgi:hypothetical protein